MSTELMPLFERLARFKIVVTSVLHIGANRGDEIDFYRANGVTQGAFIEADPDVYADLNARVGNYPGFTAVEALLSDVEGDSVDFYRATNAGLSSSMLKPAAHLREHPEVGFEAPIKLRSRRLDSLDLPHHDLVVIDVQGAELQVLRGGVKSWENSLAMWSEVNVVGLYEGDTSFHQLINFLDEHGFFLAFVDINQYLWGNALFISKRYLAYRNSLH